MFRVGKIGAGLRPDVVIAVDGDRAAPRGAEVQADVTIGPKPFRIEFRRQGSWTGTGATQSGARCSATTWV
jgi:hypothetical protein